MVSRGHLVAAAEEELAALRARLLDRLPSAQFVGAFRVSFGANGPVYEALRASLQEQRGVPLAERELWHGTSWATVPKIVRHGFNRSFAGRHGTLLGMATYFSTDPAYSHRFCDRHGGGTDKTKVLLLAQVLVGNYCRGSSSDVEPPVMDIESGERFDSTVDNEERPGIFAVFRDFQAVPLFLLEFRT
uniref:Poly [ADP-ribose] polymerase n=1 Tax=Pyrodinium bahamense TaxID=73915 RepID=A0A7S0FGF7_9DINO